MVVSPFSWATVWAVRADSIKAVLAREASASIWIVSALRGSWMVENSSMSLQLHLMVIP